MAPSTTETGPKCFNRLKNGFIFVSERAKVICQTVLASLSSIFRRRELFYVTKFSFIAIEILLNSRKEIAFGGSDRYPLSYVEEEDKITYAKVNFLFVKTAQLRMCGVLGLLLTLWH